MDQLKSITEKWKTKAKKYTVYFEKQKKINLCVRIQDISYLSENSAWEEIRGDFSVACNVLPLDPGAGNMGGLILHIIRHNKLYTYNLCAFPLVYYTSVKIT